MFRQILTPTGPVWRAARADNYHTRAAYFVIMGAKGLSRLTNMAESLHPLLWLLWWYNKICEQALLLWCAITISMTQRRSGMRTPKECADAPTMCPRELSPFLIGEIFARFFCRAGVFTPARAIVNFSACLPVCTSLCTTTMTGNQRAPV